MSFRNDQSWSEILRDCSLVRGLSEWEFGFIADLADKLDMGEEWSSREKDSLVTIWYEKVAHGED